jgi:hypothetical protein
MTKQEARQKLINKINSFSTNKILSILKGMVKHWRTYSEEERMVRAYLFDAYESREGEEETDILLDVIEAMEQR